jgi:beta-glucanase (GH16 family)
MTVATVLLGLWLASGTVGAEPPEGYELVWSDEFKGETLDEEKWAYRRDSKHWSTQQPENVTVSNGCLRLNLHNEQASGKSYTGAGVISRERFRHGYYEARIRMPEAGGWHTSFWLMKHTGKGSTDTSETTHEIDICEQDSKHDAKYATVVHKWADKHRSQGFKMIKTGNDLKKHFHVWGCEFTNDQVRFYFDGKLVNEVEADFFEHGPVNIWLTSIASHLGGTKAVEDAALPDAAVFDYVRFYKKRTPEQKMGN